MVLPCRTHTSRPPCRKTGARGCSGGEEEDGQEDSRALLVPVLIELPRRRCNGGTKLYPRAVSVISGHFASAKQPVFFCSLDVVAGIFAVRQAPGRHAIDISSALKVVVRLTVGLSVLWLTRQARNTF